MAAEAVPLDTFRSHPKDWPYAQNSREKWLMGGREQAR